jgi:intracellular septation protein
MQSLLEFAPLVVFLVTYYVAGFYAATAALMVAMVLLVAVDWLRTRKVPAMHSASAVLVIVFGAATLLLRDERFIQWKPTVLFWALAVAFLVSGWVGKQPLVQRLLGAALGDAARLEPRDWQRLNLLWSGFYVLLGILNLVVARAASQEVWVNFKVFGLTILTLAFVALQIPWLLRRAGRDEAAT